MVWGEVLQAVGGGLQAARSFLWDGAARKLTTLLASPAAFEGEHFLQVGPCSLPHALTREPSVSLLCHGRSTLILCRSPGTCFCSCCKASAIVLLPLACFLFLTS